MIRSDKIPEKRDRREKGSMETASKRGISEAVLKNIALITMTIDHLTAFILSEYLMNHGVYNAYNNQWYLLGRIIGRIAFVLYAFMLVEGAVHTRNRGNYALRLLALAVISIVPYSYVNTGQWFSMKSLNIFFLLFLGLITIYVYDYLEKNIHPKAVSILLRLVAIALSCAIALAGKVEYGMMGILLIMVFYIFRGNFPMIVLFGLLVMSFGYMANVILANGGADWIQRHSQNLLVSILNTDRLQIFGILAFPLIFLYDGRKGKQLPKPFYYFFYPVHLLIIGLIINL